MTISVATAVVMQVNLTHAQNVTVFGWASSSCGEWLQHPSDKELQHQAMGAWFDGYLTAVNSARANLGKPATVGLTTDTAGRDAWVSKYCQGHPLDTLYGAAVALVSELEKTGR